MKTITRSVERCAALATALLIAACNNGAVGPNPIGSSVNPAISASDKHVHKKKGELKVVIKVPHRFRFEPIPFLRDLHGAQKHPRYVSTSTASMTVAVSGQAPQVFNLTPGSPGCSNGAGYTTCSEAAFFPSGQQTITITLYDGLNGTGKPLSTATTTATIVAGQVNYISITLDGIVASAVVQINGASSASLPAGTAANLPVTVNAYDADHNLIIPPGHYMSPITLNNSDSSGKTSLSASSVNAPGAPLTLNYSGGSIAGTLTAEITPSVSGSPEPDGAATLTVVAAAPTVNPTSLNFSSAATQTFTATENGYSGPLSASSGNIQVATVTPASANGPSATFTVTPVGGGTTTITVSDASSNTATVSVSVTGGVIVIDQTPVATPATLTFETSASQTFSVKETDYTGVFTESDNCNGIASVGPSSAKGPSATFTVTPANGGTCSVSVTDAQGNPANVAISVSAGSLTINGKRRKPPVHGGE